MSDNLTPLEVCEALIAPLSEIAAICGLKEKAGYSWRRATEWRDAGDIASPRYMRRLLRHAAKHDQGLVAEHLIFGASERQIRALLGERGHDDAEINRRLRRVRPAAARQVAAE